MIRIVIEENPTAPDEVCDQRLPPNVKRELSGLDETDVDYICSRRARSGSRRRSAGVFGIMSPETLNAVLTCEASNFCVFSLKSYTPMRLF